ncbi:unnamed protein product [Closterium sp. NIES-54]
MRKGRSQVRSPYCLVRSPYCQVRSPYCQVRSPYCQVRSPYCQVCSPYCQVCSPYCQVRSPYCQVRSPYCQATLAHELLAVLFINLRLPSHVALRTLILSTPPHRSPLSRCTLPLGPPFPPQHLALANLAFIATVAPHQLALCPPYVLAHLEAASRTRSSSSASSSSAPPAPPLLPLSRALPTATAPNEPVLGDEEEEEECYEGAGMEQQQGMHEYGQHQPQLAYQDHLHPHPFDSTPHATAHAHSTTWHVTPSPDLASALHMARHTGLSLSVHPLASLIPSGLDADVGITSRFGTGSGVDAAAEAEVARQVRAVRKKLQQVEMLEERCKGGEALDVQQRAKVAGKGQLEKVLAVLEAGGPAAAALAAARAASAAGSGGASSAGGGSGVGGSGSEAVHDDGAAHPAATPSKAADAAAAGKDKSGKKGGQGFSCRQSEAKGKEKAPCATSASPGSSKPVAIPDSMHSAPEGPATVGAVVPPGGALFASSEQRCQSPALPGTAAHTTAAASTSSGGSGKKGARKKGRKGGLSLFLAGDLERAAITSPTPAMPAAARAAAGPSPSLSPAKPAWGIPRQPLPHAETDAPPVPAAASPARSLRDIQSEQQQQQHLHCQPHTQPQQRQGRQAALHTAPASISRPLGHSTSAAPGSGSGSSGGSSMASADAVSAVGRSGSTGSSTRRGQWGQHGSAPGLLGFVSVVAPHSASPGQAVHERVAGAVAQGAGGWRGGEGGGVAAGIKVSLGELLKASTQHKAHHPDAGGGVGKARAAPVAPWAKGYGGEGAVGDEPVARSQGISIGRGLGRGGRVGQGGGARQPVSLVEIQQQQLVAFLFQCMCALPNSIVLVVPVAHHQELLRRRSQHCGSWGSPSTALLSASPSHAATLAAALPPQRPAASAPLACSPSSPAPMPSPSRFSAASSPAVPATPHGSSARTRASGSGGSTSAAAALATTTTGAGFALAAAEAESRWYKGVEEGVRASSLRSIQIEEQAMRELKSFGFATVRVVRDG